MDRCCLNGCFNECRWIHIKDGRVLGYYYDIFMTYLTFKEDSLNDNGLYRVQDGSG